MATPNNPEPRVNIGLFLPLMMEVTLDLSDGKLTDDEIESLSERLGDTVKILGQVVAARRRAEAAAHLAQAAAGTPLPSTGAFPFPPLAVPAPAPVAPVPPAAPAPGGQMEQPTGVLIDEIRFEGLHFEGDRHGGSAGEIIGDPKHVQMAKERAKLNFTAYLKGVKVPDEIVRTLYLADGHSPVAQPEYGFLRADGSEEVHTNSGHDAFELQGYDKASGPNAGFTYVLYLDAPRGPGQSTAFGRLILPGVGNDGRTYNGGLTVKSDKAATWQTD